MAGKKHIHKYFKMDLEGVKVWACALDCTHYMPKHMEQLVIGRRSICWQCDEQFNLDAINMNRDNPLCNDCSGINHAIELLEEIEAKKLK